jgi:hypothetical protein
MSTRYKITEHYRPNQSETDIVSEIINISDSGDILIFEPGAKEINELVNKLNTTMPANMIALPFHSKIDQGESTFKKDFIEKIDSNLKYIKMDRNVIFSDASVTENYVRIGTNNYTRAVIVATNIAEASITIKSLKFVIETGTQKDEIYNYKKRGNIKKLTYISESSRIQRKGRVGRTSPGTVYYLYKKGFLELNDIGYEVAIKNMFIDLFGLMKNNDTEQPVITSASDPNSPSTSLVIDKLDGQT